MMSFKSILSLVSLVLASYSLNVTARYMQSDPVSLYGGSWSTYGYVNGNPVSSIDVYGLSENMDYVVDINLVDPGDTKAYPAMQHIPFGGADVLSIGIHGSPTQVCSTKDCAEGKNGEGVVGVKYSPEQLRELIMQNEKYKKNPNIPILLWACGTASKWQVEGGTAFNTYAGKLYMSLPNRNNLYAMSGDIQFALAGEFSKNLEGEVIYHGPVYDWHIYTNAGMGVYVPGNVILFHKDGNKLRAVSCGNDNTGSLPSC